MDLLQLLGIAIGLAMDAFAVSIVAGLTLSKVSPRHVFRLAFHFGLFQFLMPIIGYLAGSMLADSIRDYDHWIAFLLLGYVGGKMLWESRGTREAGDRTDPTRGLMLVTLSVATSIDALAVGLSMAFLRIEVWFPAIVIGFVAALFTTVGILSGSRIGPRWGRWAEVIGGCILLLIGLNILLSHFPPLPN